MTPPRPVSAPIIRVSAPRSAPKKKHHRRRSNGGGGGKKDALKLAVAGAIMGYIDRGGIAIPTIPILGRAGTIAAGLYFVGPSHGIWLDAFKAAVVIAGYEVGKQGSISGSVMGAIAPQV